MTRSIVTAVCYRIIPPAGETSSVRSFGGKRRFEPGRHKLQHAHPAPTDAP
jgi:hypothetical protein